MATSRSTKQTSTLLKVLFPVALILTFAIASLYLIKSQFAPVGRPEGTAQVQVGNVLPDFALTRLDGTTTSISKLNGKVFLINFWATWCEACMEEMPSIVKLREAFKDRGFEVVAVNLDENSDGVVPKIIKQFQIGFPVFKDPEGKVAELFDVHAIPLTVIMNQDRKLLFIKDGQQDWNSEDVRAQIGRWLAG